MLFLPKIGSAIIIAVAVLSLIIKPHKSFAQDLYSEGEALLEQQQYRPAAVVLAKATSEKPDDIEAWRLLGFSYRQLDQIDSAIYGYEKVMQIAPDDYDAHLALGLLYSWQERYDSSESMYQYILANDSTDLEALLGLGRIKAWQGHFDNAIRYYGIAIRFQPGYMPAISGMAWVYAWSGNLAKADKLFEQTIQTDPTFAEGYEGLARVCAWNERPIIASKYIGKALDLDPGNQRYRQFKNEISAVVALKFDNGYVYWQENDGGRITEYHQIEETISQRVTDRWSMECFWAGLWSFRTSTYVKRQVLALSSIYKLTDMITLKGSLGGELLRQELDRSLLRIELSAVPQLRNMAIEIRRGNFEPWSNTRSTSLITEFSTDPIKGFALSASGGFWDVSDGNQKNIGTITLIKRIFSRPVLNAAYRYRLWDYKFESPNYYSPLDLVQHELGMDFRFELMKNIGFEGDGYYTLNSDDGRALSGSITLELGLGKRTWGILSYTGYSNNFDYKMNGVTGRLKIDL